MLTFRIVKKGYVTALEADIAKLKKTELELREFIEKLAQQSPETRRAIGDKRLEEERQDESNSKPVEDAPNGLPARLNPDSPIQYSVKFEKSFSSLTEAERESVERSIRFLAENGTEHPGFKSIPLRRKVHGIDPHNCFMIYIRKRRIKIIYQNMENGIKFRDVFHEG